MNRLRQIAWAGSAVLVLAFLLSPIVVLVFSAFDDGNFFRFPPKELSLRWFGAALASPEYRASLLNSTVISLVATILSVVLGLMAAVGLTRGNLRSRAAVEILLLAPLTLPLVVWAIALLQIYARLGVSGSFAGLVLAHTIITLPLSVRIQIAAIHRIDPTLEEAARSLGARPFTAFARTTLPLALPGILSSAAFAFLVSFNDVIVTTFIAGASWITFPVRMYSQLRGQGIDPTTLAIGAMIVALILVVLALGEALFKWSRTL